MKVIICAIAKQENDYLLEWAEYHINLGFSEIHIYDNNVKEGELITDVFHGTNIEQYIIVHDIRGLEKMQMNVYQECYLNEDFDWCAFIDVDEFVTFNNNSGYSNIGDFVKSFKGVDSILINWMCFGDNGLISKTSEGVLARFTKPIFPVFFKAEYFSIQENCHVKSILRKGRNIDWNKTSLPWKNPNNPSIVMEPFINPHVPSGNIVVANAEGELIDNGPWQNINYNVLFIRHFITKTIEEYSTKKERKTADSGTGSRYEIQNFFRFNPISIRRILKVRSITGSFHLYSIIYERLLRLSLSFSLPTKYFFRAYRKYKKSKLL